MSVYLSSVPRFAGLVLSFQLALSVPATAALIPVTTSFGSGTATLDTATQREWLDLSLSQPFSYNQLINIELAPNGKFAGYQLASTPDIFGFVTDSGILSLANGNVAFDGFQSLLSMIGGLGHDQSGDGCTLVVRGVSSTPGQFNSQELGGFLNMRNPGQCMTQDPSGSVNNFENALQLFPVDFNTPLNSVSTPAEISGAWLFRDVAVGTVPTSGTFGLVFLGMLGLFGVAHRRPQAEDATEKGDARCHHSQ